MLYISIRPKDQIANLQIGEMVCISVHFSDYRIESWDQFLEKSFKTSNNLEPISVKKNLLSPLMIWDQFLVKNSCPPMILSMGKTMTAKMISEL